MDEPVVEEVITEKPSQPLEILEQPPDIVENVGVNKGGRPKGSKDSVKRVVKPRKITIVETPLRAEEAAVATSASSSGDVPAVVPAVEPAIASKALIQNPDIRPAAQCRCLLRLLLAYPQKSAIDWVITNELHLQQRPR